MPVGLALRGIWLLLKMMTNIGLRMKILNNKAGVTVLEGIIALGLLAIVTAGAFGVLASASRKSSQPDIREEMVMAVERAKDALKQYTATDVAKLCSSDNDLNKPLENGTHSIKCMLPLMCDSNKSTFKYTVADGSALNHHLNGADLEENAPSVRKITFTIECNGYEL